VLSRSQGHDVLRAALRGGASGYLAKDIAADHPASGGDLLNRVKALRRKIAADIGIVIPPLRTRNSLELPAQTYAIKLFGVEVARGEAPRGQMLAIGDFLGSLPGTPTREPVFGLEAKGIASELRSQAELGGATVVDRTSVITTHLAEIVNQHAARLLGREDVRLLTDVVKRSRPVVVEELTPTQLSLGEVQRILQSLLDEGISIRDLVRIFEAISLRAQATKDVDTLVESARTALGPAIVAQHTSGDTVNVISLDPRLEQQMLEAQRQTEAGTILALDPDTGQRVLTQVDQLVRDSQNANRHPVLVCAPQIRASLRRFLRPTMPRVPVLSYSELVGIGQISSVGVVAHEPLAVAR
jgi:flagellar biosynthesis protein FlhA